MNIDDIHANDRQNRLKHAKMERRLKRGVLRPGEKNTGEPYKSKIHPFCKWYRNRMKVLAANSK